MSEMIPRGWVLTKIPNIADINPKSSLDDSIDVGFVPMTLVPVDFSHSVNFETYKWSEVKKGYTQFKNNDVIFAKITPCFENGKAAVICNMPNDHGAGSTEYYVLRTIASPSKYLFYLIKTQDFLDTGASLMTGSVGQKRVPKSYIQERAIPFPPLNEQKRIVAKLDKIMPRIDAVKERLDKVPTIIKRFRQSVLTAAVTGKLTEKWRAEHPNLIVPQSMSSIPEKLYNSYLNIFEETQTYNIPDSWTYSPICNLGEIKGGGTPSKSNPDFWKGEIPWISPKDMKKDRISSGIDFISEESINQSSTKLIPKSSILFVVRGMILIHSFPVAITLKELTINQDMKALVPNENIEPEFLLLVFKQIGRKVLNYIKEATHGTLRLELPLFQTIAVPLPPLQEQNEIVRQVDKLFALADRLESHYQKAQARVDKLSQSVLAKAFRGELVITEAELAEKEGRDFESAEKLLARILEEKKKLDGRDKMVSGGSKTSVKETGRKKK